MLKYIDSLHRIGSQLAGNMHMLLTDKWTNIWIPVVSWMFRGCVWISSTHNDVWRNMLNYCSLKCVSDATLKFPVNIHCRSSQVVHTREGIALWLLNRICNSLFRYTLASLCSLVSLIPTLSWDQSFIIQQVHFNRKDSGAKLILFRKQMTNVWSQQVPWAV